LAVFIVLLRAIGPITHKIMSMAQWRDGVTKAGFAAPETYLATGNMIVESDIPLAATTKAMNDVVRSLGLAENSRAVVRTPEQLRAVLEANPLPEAASARPSQIGVYCFAEAKPDFGWVENYQGPENIRIVEQHLIVDYNGRVSDSKLLSGIEKKSGVATARNWNTLRGLVERSTARQNKRGQ
jgi:uncharacterized protein (DUF1697 family)